MGNETVHGDGLTEKKEKKFQTFNLENCAHFGVFIMGTEPH